MVRTSDYANDARALKQAAALSEAGARVSMVGIGHAMPAHLEAGPYEVRIVPYPPGPRLGREDVWWPLRVAVNLTYTRALFWHRRNAFYAYGTELWQEVSELRPDVVHAYNVFTLPVAARAKAEFAAKVVYDCRDLFGDVAYFTSRRRRRIRRVERQFIDAADAVMAVSEPLSRVLEARYRIVPPTVVYNGPIEVVSSASPVSQPLRILFQGGFRFDRNLETLIRGMAALRGSAVLTLQGFGDDEDKLKALVQECGVESSVSFVPPAAPLEVVTAAAAHDVGVICHKGDSLNLQLAVPNKLMDYLGAGLALAVSDLPGHRSVLEGTGAAVFLDPSSPEGLASGLQELVDDPERVARMKESSLSLARGLEWSVQADRMLELYESTIAPANRVTR